MFVPIVNTSISASWLILAIIAVRVIFKNMPKAMNCVLWSLVAIRLVCPISIVSSLSLIPSAETIPEEILQMEGAQQHDPVQFSGIEVPEIQEAVGKAVGPTVSQLQTFVMYGTFVWLAGMTAILLYALISYLRLRRRVVVSINERDNIWICDQIDTPFILGMFRPRIYIPSGVTEKEAVYVIAHEQAHLNRHDHWWKPIGFFLLAVYWFNPMIWIAYILLSRDIELACDEKVIRTMETTDKQAYSEALLICSVNRRMIAACPLAFGEVGVKARVKSVLNYKKPAHWIVVTSIVICAVVAVCFLTNPEETDADKVTEVQERVEKEATEPSSEYGDASDFQTEELRKQYHKERSEHIFRSFSMKPEDYYYAQGFDANRYLDTGTYTFMRETIDAPPESTQPSFFMTEDLAIVYVVVQDSTALNHLYKFTLSEDGNSYACEHSSIQDVGRYQDIFMSFSEYEEHIGRKEVGTDSNTTVFSEYQAEIEAINEKYGSKITLHNIPENISKEEFLAQLEEMAISSAKVSAGLQAHKDALQNASSEQDAEPSSEYTNTDQDEVQQSNVPENYIGGNKDLIVARGGKLLPDDDPESYVFINGEYYKWYEDKNGVWRLEHKVGNIDALSNNAKDFIDTLVNGDYPVNNNGESYGYKRLSSYVGYDPDLSRAVGNNGEVGYIRESESSAITVPTAAECPHEFLVNLYESDGTTIIGDFTIDCGGHFSGSGQTIDEVKEEIGILS